MAAHTTEQIVDAVHAAQPGAFAQALRRGAMADGKSSYQWLAERARGVDVLDLCSGSGEVAAALQGSSCRVTSLDRSANELALVAHGAKVRADASSLPFLAATFDTVLCHFGWMLIADVASAAREVMRVLRRPGRFAAVLGGGPTAANDDAFAVYLDVVIGSGIGLRQSLGDARSKTEAGWQSLFGLAAAPQFEREELVLDGDVAAVWEVLATGYELAIATTQQRSIMRHRFFDRVAQQWSCDKVPLRWVVWRGVVNF